MTIYVHEGDLNGTMLSGVQMIGKDAAGNIFHRITDSNGLVVASGKPGTWQFNFTKEGYTPLSLRYDVTQTDEGAVYLESADMYQGYQEDAASSQPDQQLSPISSQTNPARSAKLRELMGIECFMRI